MPTCTIAFAIDKGGSAKSMSSISLAAALARMGYKVLLGDTDHNGHCARWLGTQLNAGELGVHSLFEDSPPSITEVIRPTSVPNLDVLPSDSQLKSLKYRVFTRPMREFILQKHLEKIRNNYDFIIIDTHPDTDVYTANAITASDMVIIPCKYGGDAADGFAEMLGFIKALKGDDFENWAILMNQKDQRATSTNAAVMQQLHPWKDRMFKTEIPRCEALNQIQIMKQDIFTYAPKSTGAIAYNNLAKEIASYGKNTK